MPEDRENKSATNSADNPKAIESEKFRLGVLPFDPLFVLVALIYALTRILERLFGTERTWEKLWIGIVEYFDVNQYDFLVWVTSAFILSIFWIASLTFLSLNLTDSLQRYKVQPGKNEKIEIRKLIEALFTVLFNQCFISITFSSGAYWLSMLTLGEQDMKAVPSFLILMRDLLVSHTFFDVGFFVFHRLMHTKYFYKRIHKIHHEWKAPIGVIAIYAHPTEHLITNLLPPMLGPFFMQTQICTLWVWFATVAISTVSDHSGYHLPFLKSPEFHDHHHVNFTECFGSCGIMDFLCGTDKRFRRSINFKRHRVLLSFTTSMREMYPKRDFKLEGRTHASQSELK